MRALALAALSALTLAGCSSTTTRTATQPSPIIYAAPVPMEYDLEPMARSLAATAYNVQAAPYQAWKEHNDTVQANNSRQWINQGPKICGPLYGSADIYCH